MAKPTTKPTMDDVARRAGVSRALVSLALRGSDRVSDTSRQAVFDAAAALDYRPNLIARNLASKRTATLGLVINDLHNPYFPAVADGIKQSADERGYRLMINSAFLSDDDERAALDTFIDFRVDGIILVGARLPAADIEQAARSVPIVLVSRPLDSDVIDTVNNDDRRGAVLAVEHLIGLGHRHICHIDGGTGAGAPERRAGYLETMSAHGLEPHVEAGEFTESSGVAAARRALAGQHRCTAIFAGNDLSALGALDVIDDAGLDVPGDISLVGYDDTYVAALRHISLTSVDQGRQRLGTLAVSAIIDRIETGRTDARHEVTEPTLVVRSTTGPAPA